MSPRELDPVLAAVLDLARLAAVKAGLETPDEGAVVFAFESDPAATLLALIESTRRTVAGL